VDPIHVFDPLTTDDAGRTAAFIVQHATPRSMREMYILDLMKPSRRLAVPLSRGRVDTAVISPDGRWLASGNWRDPDAPLVWDRATLRLCHPFGVDNPEDNSFSAAFSPDGHWLARCSGDNYEFRRVGTWEAGPTIPKDHRTSDTWTPAFSPDGRIVALI